MIKIISSALVAGLIAVSFTACGGAAPKVEKSQEESADFRCRKAGQLAPEWTCNPNAEGAAYAGLGIGESKNESMRRKIAIANGREGLAKQIQTKVKAKMESFTRSTGNGTAETIDTVSTSVSKQTAQVSLVGSKAVKSWTAKTGTLYVLVTVPEKTVNSGVKDAVKAAVDSSKGNDNALWQQFQSKTALDSLDKEFPTE